MTEPGTRDLSEIRNELDTVDRDLVALLARRFTLVEAVGAAKGTTDTPIRDLDRERAVLSKVAAYAAEQGVSPDLVRRVFREVIGHAVDRQVAELTSTSTDPLVVSFQGVPLAYSHLAAQKHLAASQRVARYQGEVTFAGVISALESGKADLAVLPIENTTAGSINETYDLLAAGTLHITGEVVSAIEHCLLALPGVTLAELRTVMSHPQALAQCNELFANNPQLTARADLDTAGAAQRVAEANDRTLGAIASSAAAQRYGLAVVARGINSAIGNATRFVEVATRPAPVPEGAAAKTSLIFALADRPGVLGEILLRLAARTLSLTKLESRPIPEVPFTYRFYADVLGHAASEPFHAALEDIRPLTTDLRVLGTYPAAV
jgi:chorismate mutase/prephenate dehydratase